MICDSGLAIDYGFCPALLTVLRRRRATCEFSPAFPGLLRATTYFDAAFIGFSPRSGRQHKAWGVSPRIKEQKWIEAAKRAIAVGTHASGVLRMSSLRLCTPEACVPLTSAPRTRETKLGALNRRIIHPFVDGDPVCFPGLAPIV
jgi:hypothetical protein